MVNKKGRPKLTKIQRDKIGIQGERLQILRSEQGLSQGQLSKLTGIRQQTISKIEKFENSLTDLNADKLKLAFPDYRKEWLLGNDDTKTESEWIISNIKGKLSKIHKPWKHINKTLSMIWGEPLLKSLGYEYVYSYNKDTSLCVLSYKGKDYIVPVSDLDASLTDIAEFALFKMQILLKESEGK